MPQKMIYWVSLKPCEVTYLYFVAGGSSFDTRFGDIDERFPAVHKHRNPTTTSVPSPPEPLIPGKFQPGPSQWNDVGRPHLGSGRWEPAPSPWMRGGLGSSSLPLTQGHLSTHMHMLHPGTSQGQSVPFHRPPGPDFQPVNSYGGINRWRPPQFQSRAPFESDIER